MANIPDISFKSSEDATDIEFLNLSELFLKMESDTSHSPWHPHRLTFFALIIITEGNGTHQVDLIDYPICKGSVIKIAKGQVHAFQKNPAYSGYLVIFTEDFVLRYFSKSSIDFISHLYNYHISEPLIKNCKFNSFFFEQITSELESQNTFAQKDIIAKILELYLLQLERLTQGTISSKLSKEHYRLFNQFKNLVEYQYPKSRNVNMYAEMLNISPKHLNAIVREFTLNTAKAFIDGYVILEIKRTIFSTNISLKEVAYALGFDETTNFTKFFKKHTGLTPKEYKSSF